MKLHDQFALWAVLGSLAAALSACGAEPASSDNGSARAPTGGTAPSHGSAGAVPVATTSAGRPASAPVVATGAAGQGTVSAPGAPLQPSAAGMPAPPVVGVAGMAAPARPMPGAAGSPATAPMPPPGATGPDDGDPNAPVVAVPEIACGGPKGFGATNLKVGGRDVMLTYPCNKHEGANVTFILLLHGTNSNEASKLYTHNYFAAFQLASTHNLIIAEPKSRASQWGNTMENPDAAQDKPHLLEVIDYVYTTFSKLHINSLWVAGHSWGAMYAKRFVCDDTIKDKARGVIGMSGGTTAPGGRSFGSSGSDLMPTPNCADYISQIHTLGDMDSVMGLPDQTAPATKHGCEAKTAAMDIGKMQMLAEWPGCDPGWVHEEFTMGAHTHTTAINPEVVKQIIEKVKATDKH